LVLNNYENYSFTCKGPYYEDDEIPKTVLVLINIPNLHSLQKRNKIISVGGENRDLSRSFPWPHEKISSIQGIVPFMVATAIFKSKHLLLCTARYLDFNTSRYSCFCVVTFSR
jgi:hypothetical protein